MPSSLTFASRARDRGRPRAPDPGARLSTWVPVREYDRLVKLAKTRDQSLSSLVRDLLKLKLR